MVVVIRLIKTIIVSNGVFSLWWWLIEKFLSNRPCVACVTRVYLTIIGYLARIRVDVRVDCEINCDVRIELIVPPSVNLWITKGDIREEGRKGVEFACSA